MINWDYWEWQKKFKPPVITRWRVKKQAEPSTIDEEILKLLEQRKPSTDAIAVLEKKIDYLNERFDALQDDLPVPIMSLIDQQNTRIEEQLAELREELIIIRKEIASNQMPKILQEPQEKEITTYHVIVKDAHREIMKMLLQASGLISYQEIGEKLKMAKSSVRVYVSDLHRLEFPLIKKKVDGRNFIGIPAEKNDQASKIAEIYGI